MERDKTVNVLCVNVRCVGKPVVNQSVLSKFQRTTYLHPSASIRVSSSCEDAVVQKAREEEEPGECSAVHHSVHSTRSQEQRYADMEYQKSMLHCFHSRFLNLINLNTFSRSIG